MKKLKITLRGSICAVLAGMVLSACAPVAGFAGKTVEPIEEPRPLYDLTAFHGPFDEICLFRYYDADEVGQDSIPDACAYGGSEWSLSEITGPIDIEFGPCWEARYSEDMEQR